MARPLRIEFPGAAYHVTGRGNAQRAVFEDDADREQFLGTLERSADRFGLLLHGFCLMGNHYHLLVETPDAGLGRGDAGPERCLYTGIQPASRDRRPPLPGPLQGDPRAARFAPARASALRRSEPRAGWSVQTRGSVPLVELPGHRGARSGAAAAHGRDGCCLSSEAGLPGRASATAPSSPRGSAWIHLRICTALCSGPSSS